MAGCEVKTPEMAADALHVPASLASIRAVLTLWMHQDSKIARYCGQRRGGGGEPLQGLGLE